MAEQPINDGGPAFPQVYRAPNDRLIGPEGGMTLRDFFAAAALMGILALPSGNLDEQEAVESAYIHADAMLAARTKK